MTAPRVRTLERSRNDGWFRYRQHDIHLYREGRRADWYITVMHPSGGYLYDGWWNDSFKKTMREAVVEACTGAGLLTTDAGEHRE